MGVERPATAPPSSRALHGLTYAELTTGKGSEAAAAYAMGNMAALAKFQQLIGELGIDCKLTEAEAFTCAATDAGVEAIEREADAAAHAGLAVSVTSSTELGALVKRACVCLARPTSTRTRSATASSNGCETVASWCSSTGA